MMSVAQPFTDEPLGAVREKNRGATFAHDHVQDIGLDGVTEWRDDAPFVPDDGFTP